MSASKPLLWHIWISHYSEKARWALDFKRVPHRRRAMPGGFHMIAALALSHGEVYTFPILELDGEELGPPLRLLGFHEMVRDPERLSALMDPFLPPPARGSQVARDLAARFSSAFTGVRYGVRNEERAEQARREVVAALDRLEAELDGTEFLAGDRFSVADLTAAALFYPLVLPPQGPELGDPPDGFQRFREPLEDRPGYQWVAEMFRAHRLPASADSAVPA
jgi:glutathione S-transferase